MQIILLAHEHAHISVLAWVIYVPTLNVALKATFLPPSLKQLNNAQRLSTSNVVERSIFVGLFCFHLASKSCCMEMESAPGVVQSGVCICVCIYIQREFDYPATHSTNDLYDMNRFFILV
jgi:hypothetical protein